MCLCEAAGIWAMDRRKPIVFMLESGQVEGVNRILLCVQTGVCAELMPRLLHSASAEPGCWQQHGCAVSSGHHHSLPPFSLCRHTYSRYKYLEDGSLFFSKTKLLRTRLQPAPNIKSPPEDGGNKKRFRAENINEQARVFAAVRLRFGCVFQSLYVLRYWRSCPCVNGCSDPPSTLKPGPSVHLSP